MPTQKFELSPSISILIAGVIIAGAIVFVNLDAPVGTPTQVQRGAGATTADGVPPPTAEDHIVGSPSAPIVLIEYSDLQCPYCSLIHPSLKRIVAESSGEIAWVYRHFPLTQIHAEAQPAAVASECIAEQLGDEGFWSFTDTIFNNQKSMSTAYYTQLAGQLGADTAAFNACVASGKYDSEVSREYQEAVALGGQGTPYTVVRAANGTTAVIPGALPYEQLLPVINSVR